MSDSEKSPAPECGRPGPGGYEILENIARSHQISIYKARYPLFPDRIVALKILTPGHDDSPHAVQRFTLGAQALAIQTHPNIIRILDRGTSPTGCEYMVLEYADAGNLAHHLRGGPLPPRTAARLIEIVTRAVNAVHQERIQRILHRDLKPSSILFRYPGDPAKPGEYAAGLTLELGGEVVAPKLTSFSLCARLADDGLTQDTHIRGAPLYLAPEMVAGERLGPAADVYSLGVILYEALTGVVPIRGGSLMETFTLLCTTCPRPPRALQPSIHPALDRLCMLCLEKDPAARPKSAEVLANALRTYLDETTD
jgi:eukaryotic-like serine/threonine-protein kinase